LDDTFTPIDVSRIVYAKRKGKQEGKRQNSCERHTNTEALWHDGAKPKQANRVACAV